MTSIMVLSLALGLDLDRRLPPYDQTLDEHRASVTALCAAHVAKKAAIAAGDAPQIAATTDTVNAASRRYRFWMAVRMRHGGWAAFANPDGSVNVGQWAAFWVEHSQIVRENLRY